MGGVGGYKRTCKGLFTEFVNQLPELDPNNLSHAAALRYQQGITPGLMLDATSIDLPEDLAKTTGGRTLADVKALAPRKAYSESTSTALSHSVEKRQKQVSPVYQAAARAPDAELDSQPGSPGPAESKPNTCNSGEGRGPRRRRVRGAAHAFHAITDVIASRLTDGNL